MIFITTCLDLLTCFINYHLNYYQGHEGCFTSDCLFEHASIKYYGLVSLDFLGKHVLYTSCFRKLSKGTGSPAREEVQNGAEKILHRAEDMTTKPPTKNIFK